jgi:hypothetical protein
MKISIIADSLAMPRIDSDEVIAWEDTWPIQLDTKFKYAQQYISFSINNMRARTVSTLIGSDFYESIEVIQPKVIIVQVGVVDCMPRIFSKRENELLNHRLFPGWLRSTFIRNRSKNRKFITKGDPLRKVYTKPDKFESILDDFASRINKVNITCKVIFLPILIKDSMEQKSPGCISNVKLYNQILQSITERNKWMYLNIDDENMDFFLKDGYHLNRNGHLIVARHLEVLINHILRNETS